MHKRTFSLLASEQSLDYDLRAVKAFVSEEILFQRIYLLSQNILLTEHILEEIHLEFKKQKRKVTICNVTKEDSYTIQEYSECDVLFLLDIDKCSNAQSLQEILANRIVNGKNTLVTCPTPAESLPFINSTLLCLLKDSLFVLIQDITFSLFVYGTLKKGFHNHPYLANSKFISTAKTAKKYPMIQTNPAFPYLIYQSGKGHQIHGEVYTIDYKTLLEIDALEGCPTHYKRDVIEVILENKQKIKSWCYFLAEKIDYKQYDLLSCFKQDLTDYEQ